jgi:hypothetical protein
MFSAKLMDFLPCAKSGFILRNSATLLFYIYIKNNNLQEKENKQYSRFDDLLDKIFVEMNSEFYSDPDNGRMLMTEAIEREIIKCPLSTQNAIRLKRPEFNLDNTPIRTKGDNIIYRKSFHKYYFQLLTVHNIYSTDDLIRLNKIDVLEIINNEVIQKQMFEEYKIIYSTLDKWKNYNK